MKTKKGIDFVMVTYGLYQYLPCVVESIHKYTKDNPYSIYIVNNYCDLEKSTKILEDMFKDDDTVTIVEGADQSGHPFNKDEKDLYDIDYEAKNEWGHLGYIKKHWNDRYTGKSWVNAEITGNGLLGSYYGTIGYNKGWKIGNRETIGFLQCDTLILRDWEPSVIPFLDDNFLVTGIYETPAIMRRRGLNFTEMNQKYLDAHWKKIQEGPHDTDEYKWWSSKTRGSQIDIEKLKDFGYAIPQFLFIKRKNLTDNNLELDNSWHDTGGNLSLFAIMNNKKIGILGNSHLGQGDQPLGKGFYTYSDKGLPLQYHLSHASLKNQGKYLDTVRNFKTYLERTDG